MLKGGVLAYSPNSNEAEWIPVRGTFRNLLQAEERPACALANLIVCAMEKEERLRFVGHKGMQGSSAGTKMYDDFEEFHNMGVEEVTMSYDDGEEVNADYEDKGPSDECNVL